ncbi:ribonuclease R [Patescibacteria group bacterium]|nr:ribonuclease R [Patescibacteria group bacterium]
MPPERRVSPSQAEKKTISGIVQVTRKGVGYMPISADAPKKKSSDDIEIFPEKLNGALNGDHVEVELLSVFPRPRGRVKKIVQRAKTRFVCTLRVVTGKHVAVADDMRFPKPIEIVNSKEDKEGTKVLVELTSFDGEKAVGKIVEVIGAAGEHRVEMNAIVLEHGFETQFPPEVLAQAQDIEKNHAKIIAGEAGKRTDFRNKLTFTIDPVDAKDFDDALSIEQIDADTYEIGVHIADASYFVRPGTALDDEAIKRGTSVYLVDATIPMLPHELSGNVCSLKADEDRLAFSAIFNITTKGEVLSRRFEKTIIRSNKRFTYEQAQEILDGKVSAPEYAPALNTLWSIAQILRKEKTNRGAIDFGDNEVRFTLDENGTPIGVVRKERIDTNLLIEEFMLLANREVAKYVSKLAEKNPEHGFVFLYRIHDDPKPDRIDELATFVRAIGYDFGQNKKKPTAKDIAKLLKDIEGTPEEHLIRTATLRSMAKAIYSTRNIGHFGLAFDYYTHFTSPIRRYPDVLVHRILASHLDGHPITRKEYISLEKMCIAASEREAKAVSAERDSIRYKQVEYLSARIGQEFDAIVSGVTDWGMYVEDKETASEGLVRMRSLEGDFFEHRPKEYAVVGQRTQKKYALGDSVRVKLVAADLAARTADFELVSA